MLLFLCVFIVGLLFTFCIITRVASKIFLLLLKFWKRFMTRSFGYRSALASHVRSSRRTSTAHSHGESYDIWRCTCFEESLEGERCRIFAWPSNDSVVIKNYADAVEMMLLGVDRFEPLTHRYPDYEQERSVGTCL